METQTPEPVKTKVLCLFDSPVTATGFAQVSRNILNVLLGEGSYEPVVVGINHSDYYDQKKFPYPIYEAAPALVQDPRYRDLYGRQRFLDFLGTGKFDLVFTIQDTFIMEDIASVILQAREQMAAKNKQLGEVRYKPFKWIGYFPIDGVPKMNWITKSAMLADYPVCYTKWGKAESVAVVKAEDEAEAAKADARIEVIYHGTNLKDFHPIDDAEALKKFRTGYFQGKADGKFLIINVNRNQPRKDLARTLAVFNDFVAIHPDAFLYMHCQAHDTAGNILEVARSFKNLHLGQNWTLPADFGASKGVPIEELNQIYNAADAVITTTLGEGWGLSMTEAMATKTLIIAPRNTSTPEIIGENEERGLLADSGKEWMVLQNDNEVIRPITSVASMVEKLCYAYDHKDKPEIQDRITAAYAWVQQLAWEGEQVGGKWLNVFKRATDALLKDKWIGEQKVGRNDPCVCGSGKKSKHCHNA